MSRPWTQDELNKFVEDQNRVLWILALVLLLIFGVYLVTGAGDDGVRRDSEGVPCTISTAQNADGTAECQ